MTQIHRPCASISLFAERNPPFVDTKFLETSEGTHGSPNGQGALLRPVPWEERAGTAHPAEMMAIVLVSRPPTPVPRIRHWMPRTQGRRSEASRSEWKSPCLCRGHGWWLIHPPPFSNSPLFTKLIGGSESIQTQFWGSCLEMWPRHRCAALATWECASTQTPP